ncbi:MULTISPECIES: hypothetical protein [unclassified Microbacterium]|uniref:hypothetical protein n=2 Tax=Microbacterium TaxID=33882 RepID=UPI000A79530C|nr:MULTISPECIES: hypothetical protein [unclassified Microbacterium]
MSNVESNAAPTLRKRRRAGVFLRLQRSRAAEDSGAALILVVAVGAVLSMLMTLLVVVTVNGMRQATDDADWNAALAAAYAGIDEYQSRLSADTSYYRYGNAASTFSASSAITPDDTNPAFGVGASGTWAQLSGADGTARGEFRYEVDNSTYGTTGRIRLRSTGKVGDATRTLIADLKQQGFIDFLYFTDLEVTDPAVASSAPASSCYDAGTPPALRYGWNSRPSGSTNPCNDISFGAFDTIDGPLHSNDTIRACGTVFKGMVTTGKPSAPYYLNQSANGGTCATPTFEVVGSPAYAGVSGMPATNSELKKETRSDLTATDVPRPGCLYTGPTQFTFYADGTVNIKSPFTKATRIANAGSTSGSAPSECGAISALQSVAGATITVPENNVMYVQNVPAVTSDVNYWAASNDPANFTCTSTGSTGQRGWRFGTGSNAPGYPLRTSSTSTTEVATTTSPYGCRTGDAFVKGEFNGASTIAAENSIFIVGDLTYVDQNDDILGLVGNNAVWVYNPVNSSNTFLLSKNRTIHAAILSVAHTFQVQNYAVSGSGARGTLTVLGAIAQKYRGPVATATSGGSIVSGYAKNYIYDNRFKFKAPPKFLNPVTTTYGVTSWVETSAVFAADGSAR